MVKEINCIQDNWNPLYFYPLRPIYKWSVDFTRDFTQGEIERGFDKSCPKELKTKAGKYKVKNYTVDVMYRNYEETISKSESDTNKLVKTLREKYSNVIIQNMSSEFLREDTWLLRWFSHETCTLSTSYRDTDTPDDYYISSFREYVQRHERINQKVGEGNYDNGYICLMGAEEEWRWKANPEEHNDKKVCRCNECLNRGKVMICH